MLETTLGRIDVAGYGTLSVTLPDAHLSGIDYVSLQGDNVFAQGLSDGEVLLSVPESKALRKALKRAERIVVERIQAGI